MSRLIGGLVVSTDQLSVPSRRRFLERLADWRRLSLRADALDWLAKNISGSGRQLIAALERLESLNRSQPQALDAAAVRAFLESEIATNRPTIERIVRCVGRLFRKSPKSILGRDRQPGSLLPRHASMYLARELTDLSLAQIGDYFGRDHSTVRHACEKVAELLANDTELATNLKQLRAEIGGPD